MLTLVALALASLAPLACSPAAPAAVAAAASAAPPAAPADPGPPRPPGWCAQGHDFHTATRAYCLLPAPVTWEQAGARCREGGGRLARPGKQELAALRRRLLPRVMPRRDYWIGLAAEQESWRWRDGSPLSYGGWYSGAPLSTHDSPCAYMLWREGRWVESSCSAHRAALCELPARPTPQASGGFQVFLPNSELFETSFGLYALVDEALTADEADARCARLGGALASLGSPPELAALAGDFGAPMRPWRLWLGLSDQRFEGDWRWEDDQPATDIEWMPGAPDNAGTREHCGELLIDAVNDMPCESSLAALCEAP